MFFLWLNLLDFNRICLFVFFRSQIQFAILVVHFGHGFVIPGSDCAYPKILSFVGFSQNLFMIVLFSDFYWRAYGKKKVQHKSEWERISCRENHRWNLQIRFHRRQIGKSTPVRRVKIKQQQATAIQQNRSNKQTINFHWI